jgi:hypothetical protein
VLILREKIMNDEAPPKPVYIDQKTYARLTIIAKERGMEPKGIIQSHVDYLWTGKRDGEK